MRLSLLVSEFRRFAGSTLHVNIGRVVPFTEFQHGGDRKLLTQELHGIVHALAGNEPPKPPRRLRKVREVGRLARQKAKKVGRFASRKARGVTRIVKLSAIGSDSEPGIQLGRWHRAIERHLESSGLGYTILRPNNFMQNFMGYYPPDKQGNLYVAEYGTGVIHVYDLQGAEIQSLDTGKGEGALYGIEIGPDGALWVVDKATPAVYRLDPQ